MRVLLYDASCVSGLNRRFLAKYEVILEVGFAVIFFVREIAAKRGVEDCWLWKKKKMALEEGLKIGDVEGQFISKRTLVA